MRIASNYRVFSHTFDEPCHLATGLEWVDRGAYSLAPQQPPLARIGLAFGVYQMGLHYSEDPDCNTAGKKTLYSGAGYEDILAVSRAGNLPWFWIASLGVFFWCRRLTGAWPALAAVLLFTNLPPVLAHAGLATVDMGLTATFVWAVYTFTLWLERPSLRTGLVFALALAAMVLSKFSCFLFFPAAVAAILIAAMGGRPRPALALSRRAAQLAAVALLSSLVIWAGYRFSIGTLANAKSMRAFLNKPHGRWDRWAHLAANTPLPADKLFWGIGSVGVHAQEGHKSYFLGEVRSTGVWYFFPVLLAVKTPLGFLALALVGVLLSVRGYLRRRDWRLLAPAAAAAAMLLASLPATINIGLRHILPIYPLLSIVAAVAVAALWNSRRLRGASVAVAAALMAQVVVSAAIIHPDYLAYYNQLAGSRPELIHTDSDLDWGQDLFRLRDRARELKIPALSVLYYGDADLTMHGLPGLRILHPGETATGWVAVSLNELMVYRGSFGWLDGLPYQMVGRSIRLYWVPERRP
ncbi:MAG: ArnT family glycosyltransferase [Bryobacteraceae bacterium]